MSSSSVCQGLQSCLEPRVIEPRVLRLKLTPPGSNLSSSANNTSARASPSLTVEEKNLIVNNEKKNEVKSNKEENGFGFLQALSNNSHCDDKEKENENKEVYVHPTVKRSASMLSDKSLEMCTESLGSETGSNAGESIDDISLFETKHDDVVVLEDNNTNWGASRRANNNNNNRPCNFPPPLTSITDFGGVHVRPHREGGRLILEAVASSSPTPYFHAERGDGRLILRLFEGVFNSEVEGEEEEEEVEEKVSEEEEQLEESVENMEDEMGVKKFARPSRCKESGNRDIFFGDGYFELSSLSLCL